jgi:hypothetical protein
VLAQQVLGDVALVPAGATRPCDPQRPGREDALSQRRQALGELGRRPEEGDQDVGGSEVA